MSRRVLLLTSDTGAGHRSVAEALRAGAADRQEWQVDLVPLDPFRILPPALRANGRGRRKDAAPAPDAVSLSDQLVRLYGPLVVRAPWLWGGLFHLADNSAMLGMYLTTFGPPVQQRIERALLAADAQAMVSVHPLLNHLMVQ